MEERIQQKPTAVRVIGIFLIVTSAYMILTSPYAIASAWSFDSSLLLFSPTVTFIINTFWLVYYVALLIVSVHFLKAKEWARSTIDVFTWIYLFLSSGISAYMLIGKPNHMEIIFESSGFELTPTMGNILLGLQISILVFSLAIAVAILIYLRSSKVRNAMIH